MTSGRRPRIVFASTVSGFGGAEKVLLDLATHLESGIEAILLAPEGSPILSPEHVGSNLRVATYPPNRLGSVFTIRRLRRALLALEPDLILFNLPGPFDAHRTLGLMALFPRRIPILTLNHLTDTPPWRRIKLQKRITQLGVRLNLAITEAGAEQLVRLYGLRKEKVEVLRLGVAETPPGAEERGQELRTHLGLGPEDRLALFLGRLGEQKQPGHLIRVAARTTDPRWKFALVGDGPLRPEVERARTALADPTRVYLAGFSLEPAAWLAACDVLLLTSSTEGSPLVVMEAFRQGKPVLTYPFAAVGEMMEDGVEGRIIPSAEPEAMAAVLDDLVASPARLAEMGRAARARYESAFRLESNVRHFEEICERFLSPRPR